MASAAALKMAAICMLVMCVGSQMIVHASPDQDAAAGALLQELMEHELAEKLGLNADNVGDISARRHAGTARSSARSSAS